MSRIDMDEAMESRPSYSWENQQYLLKTIMNQLGMTEEDLENDPSWVKAKVREANIDKQVVYGTVEILDTPSGKILQSLIESGVKLGISSRGVGTTKKQGDYHIVQDDFQLICWDFVSEPSTPGAFMLPEGKTINPHELKNAFNKSDRIDRILNDILSLKR